MSGPIKPMFNIPLSGSTMKIDRPHKPWGEHVDIITPLGSGIPGVQKLRIGKFGELLSEDFKVR